MKITTKYPAVAVLARRDITHVEHRYTVLPCGTNVYQTAHDRSRFDVPVYGVRLNTATVLDYDFHAARRLKGAGRLALLAACAAVVFPVAVLGEVFEIASRLVQSAATACIGGLCEVTGATDTDYSLSEDFRRHWDDIVS